MPLKRAIPGTKEAAAWAGPLWDGLLALGTLVAWELRFGRLGPAFNSDVAVHGAMVLRPIDQHFIYYWGQGRLGSLVPALGKILRASLGLPAAEAAQLAVYLLATLALLLMLGLVQGPLGKLFLAGFCAFPALGLAQVLVTPGEPLPGMLLFGAWQVRLLLAWRREPTRWLSFGLGLAGAGLVWSGELGCFLFLGEALALAVKPPPFRFTSAAWVAAGASPFVLLIVVGKHLAWSPPLFRPQLFTSAVDSLWHLGDQLAVLWPFLGTGTYFLIAVLAGAGFGELVRAFRARETPGLFAILAPVPLFASVGVGVSRWFLMNQRSPRYLTLAVVLAAWVAALILDPLVERLPARARALGFGLAVALSGAMVLVDSRGNDALRSEAAQWTALARWTERSGCQGVIAPYANSYPYFTLSEGRLPATPYEGEYVRSRELADETMGVSLLCAVPWGDGPCLERLDQFGVHRVLRDEVDATVNGEAHRLCRYDRG